MKYSATNRVQEAIAIRQAEPLFHAAFERAAIGIALVDLNGYPIECNAALERILGYSEAELRTMAFPEFTHPDDVQADLELYHGLLAGERDHYQIEKRYVRKDGRIVWSHLTISLIDQEVRKPSLVIALVEDVTAQKIAEEALRDSEEKFCKAFHGNPNPILITRIRDGVILEANRAFGDWFGVSPQQARGKSTLEIGLWRTAEEREELRELLRQKGCVRDYQRVAILPSGEERITVLSIQPISIHGEECYLGISTDVTPQIEAEKALQRSEEHLRRALEAARMGTWEWDIRTGRVTWSEGVHSLFGLALGEFGGTIDAALKMVHVEDRERVQREIDLALTDPRRKYYSELRILWPDGSVHWVESRGEVRRDSNGNASVMSGTVVAITDRKRTELALRSSEESLRATIERELRSREEFTKQLLKTEEQERQRLASELHDSLGQHLSLVKNTAYLASQQADLRQPAIDHLNNISRFATEAIADLRALVYNLRPVQIEQLGLTDSLRALVEKLARSTPIRLQWRIEEIDDVIAGESATHLYRIVQELLNNLIKHSEADAAALVLERDIKCLRVRLSDNGRGFDLENASKCGGLGLTSMKERAQILGGSLKIESAPGLGADLVVELPIPDTEPSH
jgi:PAS domain S-box-containing protein